MTTQKAEIDVYISYKTTDKEQLETLKQAFSKYNDNSDSIYYLKPVYSEGAIGEGDNIVDFMDKIAVAGVVVFLLSKTYFQSPFCWYELIKSNEKGNLNSRSSILPIQFDEFDQETDIANLKIGIEEWKKNKTCQQVLADRLKITKDELPLKIQTFETEVLDHWIQNVISKKTSEQTIQEVETCIRKIFKQESEKFDRILLKNIKNELRRIAHLQESWEDYSGDSSNVEGLAKTLMEMSYSDALIEIKAWAENEKNSGELHWHSFFNKIQRLAGWFVLKSIKQDWWFNHKLALTDGINNQPFIQLFLIEEQFSYSEVVVSRGLLDIVENAKPALFALDSKHDLIPDGKQSLIVENDSFVIDSGDDAKIHTVLTPLFIDIKKTKPTEPDNKKLLAEFIRLVKADKERYFYLVKQRYLQQLKDCKSPDNSDISLLEQLNQSLKDKLVFIVIDAEQKPKSVQVSDAPLEALTYIQKILLVDKNYQTNP